MQTTIKCFDELQGCTPPFMEVVIFPESKDQRLIRPILAVRAMFSSFLNYKKIPEYLIGIIMTFW